MDWNAAKDQVLGFLTLGCVGWITYELRNLRVSVEKLNVSLAVVVERIGYHERQMKFHSSRLDRLEERLNHK